MKGLITLFAFLLFISGELYSQAADYVFSSSTGTYSEITGTVSSATGDDSTQTLPIGFSFNYCGTAYTTAIVCTNGWLELGTTYLEASHANVLASTIVKPIIAGLWDFLCDDDSSDIQYTTLGSSPNRIYVVQWKQIRWQYCDGERENFQVRLYETSNKIEIIFGTMNNPLNIPPPSASIGMNDFTGGPGHFLSVTPGEPPTVSSTTAKDNIEVSTYLTSGLTYTFNPANLIVQPGSIDFGYIASGNSTEAQTYDLSGINLITGPIVVTAPDGFEVSLNGTAWSGSVSVSYTPPTLTSTTIYARFSPSGSPADYTGNITNTGGGASKNVDVTGTSFYPLCAAGSDLCLEYIGQVQIGTIDNSSDCSEGGYADYTSLFTNMYKTVGYSITITNPNYFNDDRCGIWADWNMNGSFYDEGEEITVSGNPEVWTATIVPPANAVEGSIPLRIRIHYTEEATDPCGNSAYGEVEDYTINVLAIPSSPTFSITPEVKNYDDCPLNNFSTDYFTQTFTVHNIGAGILTINDVFLTGGDTADFVITDTNAYPIGLTGNSTIQFMVNFNPGTIGTKITTLRIQSSAKTNHDVVLSGNGIVYAPQNLSGVATADITNELSWDPPLPEGEVRYDRGSSSGWYFVNEPTTESDYIFTRFTAPVNGNLDYVALYQFKFSDSPNWAEIMVCPENGTTNTPDLNKPMVTYTGVPIDSVNGAWKILPLTPTLALTAGTDFFLVTHWPSGCEGGCYGPYMGSYTFSNFARSGYSSNGTSWSLWSGTYMMRAYMSTATERSLLSYDVLRGDSEGTLSEYVTGLTATNYTDGSVSPMTVYYYGITAQYTGNQQSGISNVLNLLTLADENSVIWTGNVSTEWDNSGNWDSGTIPDGTIKVIIPSDPVSDPNRFPVINNAVNCYNINIGPGAVVTVQSPGVLNINNP
jgi:hypothetical protein